MSYTTGVGPEQGMQQQESMMSAKRKSVSAKTVAKKSVKSPVKPPATVIECPYRPGSYAQVFQILYANREQGISKPELLKKLVGMGGKEQNISWNIAVVTSPDAEGNAHRSANKGANRYWVEKTPGGLLKLHLR